MEELKLFSKNIFSQNGEDGVIEELLSRLIKAGVVLDKWCCEFGAWDGVHLSNTCNLIRNHNYSAVLIEGDQVKVDLLNSNFPQPSVIKICKFVHFEGETLENILALTPIICDFDFLSIDIDGVDYFIFESLYIYKPKIICIEFNQTIPNSVDFVQQKSFSVKQGSSALAISRLAASKGYQVVFATNSNLILVRNDLVKFVIDSVPSLVELNPAGNNPQYIFVGYDGTILSNKSEINLVWHGLIVDINKIQYLPTFLRKFDYGIFSKVILRIYLFLKNTFY